MSEGISQEEIDALLQGLNPQAADDGDVGANPPWSELHPHLSQWLIQAWTSAQMLLGREVRSGNPEVSAVTTAAAAGQLGDDDVVVQLSVTSGARGTVYAYLPRTLALALAAAVTDQPEAEAGAELDATAAGALQEALGEMAGRGLARLEPVLGTWMVQAERVVAAHGDVAAALADDGDVLQAHTTLEIGADTARVGFILATDTARILASRLAPTSGVQTRRERPAATALERGRGTVGGGAPVPTNLVAMPAVFAEFGSSEGAGEPRNMDLLMDVSLSVTVELGRTRKQIRDVLGLAPGAVLELEKLAGEPVDVLVNGKLIARGEVLVIGEQFGVRITDIISRADRAASVR